MTEEEYFKLPLSEQLKKMAEYIEENRYSCHLVGEQAARWAMNLRRAAAMALVEPQEFFVYSPCHKHLSMPFTGRLGAVVVMKQICPICEETRQA